MVAKVKAGELVGKDLHGFEIAKMTEVYSVNEDGIKSRSHGFFRNPDIAVAFAGLQRDPTWYRVAEALVLTDGVVGYPIEDRESVNLFSDEAEALEIKKKASRKLSPAERKLLGLE